MKKYQPYLNLGNHYIEILKNQSLDGLILDQEFAHVQKIMDFIQYASTPESDQLFLDLLVVIREFLLVNSLNELTIGYCGVALEINKRNKINLDWVYLLRSEANYAIGEWNEALADSQEAVRLTLMDGPEKRGRVIFSRGLIQMNRGDYSLAVRDMLEAQDLFEKVGAWEMVARTKAELAAYYLHRGNLRQSENFYREAIRVRASANLTPIDDHTQLMLGVLNRKQRKYQEAHLILTGLVEKSTRLDNKPLLAMASHHLAWVYLNQRMIIEAKSACLLAYDLYEKLEDARGLSDVQEQLGMICWQEGDLENAIGYLTLSLETRLEIGNQQGTASSLRHLGILKLLSGQIFLGINNLFESTRLYFRLGVININKIWYFLKELGG